MPLALRFVLFIGLTSALLVGIQVYLYRRLVRDATSSKRLRRWGIAFFGLLGFALVLVRMRFLRLPGTFAGEYALGAWLWFGMSLYLFLFFAVADLARKVGRRVFPPRQTDEARRLFLARAVASTAVVSAGGGVSYGAWRAFHAPVVTEVAVKLPNLPRALDGFTLVQVSDIHVGTVIERKFVLEMVARMNALKPDLVAVTGDLVDGDVEQLGSSVAAFRELNARYGAWFCTGNHEYYSGELEWCAALPSLGLQPLRNRRVVIGDAAASFDLIGVDDWSQRFEDGYDLARAVEGRDPSRPGVLLAHQPKGLEEALAQGIGLQLSGHTHGGQMFPATVLIPLLWEYSAGLYSRGNGHIFVSRGAGFWGPPLRVGSPPEIVKVTLLA